MNDEIGIQIVNYFRDNFQSGPSFHELKRFLSKQLGTQMESTFWS